MISINESGLEFGPFEDEDCFQIELSEAIRNLGDGVKIPEFIAHIKLEPNTDGYIAIVEAKSSIPKEREIFFQEIKEKFINAVTIFCASLLGRHPDVLNEIPSNLKVSLQSASDIKLVLVIPAVPDEYLPQITDSLRHLLSVECKIWGLKDKDIFALNHRLAAKHGFCH